MTRSLALLLFAGAPLHAAATADIAVSIAPDRQAHVREHFSLQMPQEFAFLVSPCARVENLQVGGVVQPIPALTGPWITVPGGLDLSYDAVPVSPNPRTCAIPVVMPKMILDSVSLTVEGSMSGVALPHMQRDRQRWTAVLPAVPSKIDVYWPQGDRVAASAPLETGLFFPNFVGLVAVLVTWTIAYLLWARRQA